MRQRWKLQFFGNIQKSNHRKLCISLHQTNKWLNKNFLLKRRKHKKIIITKLCNQLLLQELQLPIQCSSIILFRAEVIRITFVFFFASVFSLFWFFFFHFYFEFFRFILIPMLLYSTPLHTTHNWYKLHVFIQFGIIDSLVRTNGDAWKACVPKEFIPIHWYHYGRRLKSAPCSLSQRCGTKYRNADACYP